MVPTGVPLGEFRRRPHGGSTRGVLGGPPGVFHAVSPEGVRWGIPPGWSPGWNSGGCPTSVFPGRATSVLAELGPPGCVHTFWSHGLAASGGSHEG
jgi:hypothetical protein